MIPTLRRQQRAVSRLSRIVLWANVLVIGTLATVGGLALSASRDADKVRARENAANLAAAVAAEVSSDLKQIDNVLVTVATLAASGSDTPQRRAAIAAALRQQRALIPQVDALRVTDALGIVWAGEPANNVPIDLSDRDYFKAARNASGMVISEPLRGRIIQKWGIILARSVRTADGAFAGVVYSNLSSEYLVSKFKRIDVGRGGAITLRSGTLQLIARYAPASADTTKDLGSNIVSGDLLRALATNPSSGTFVSETALDGVERASAYSRVAGTPLLMLAGLSTDEVLGRWRRDAVGISILAALAVLTIIGSSVVVWVQRRAQQNAYVKIEQLALEQEAMLDNELVGMVRVHNRLNIWKNRALEQIFGYTHEELIGKASRLLYLDDASHERVGRAYEALAEGERFRTELQMRRKDGSAVWIDLSGASVSAEESLWMMVDVSLIKEREEYAARLALHDALTGLPNRTLFVERLTYILAGASRTGAITAVCFLDLDGFKAINDQHGHRAGDLVLRTVSQRMIDCLRADDVVARFGGDEFALALTKVDPSRPREEVAIALTRLLEAIALPVQVDGTDLFVGASIGVAMSPLDSTDLHTLMQGADEAMYRAKRAGKHQVRFEASTV